MRRTHDRSMLIPAHDEPAAAIPDRLQALTLVHLAESTLGCKVDSSFAVVGRRGTMLYRAQWDGRTVALKIGLPNRHAGVGFTAATRLQREAGLISHLPVGPWPRLAGAGWLDAPQAARPSPFYQMTEWIDGPTLSNYIRGRRREPASFARAFADAACGVFGALSNLHGHGFVHGDLHAGHFIFESARDGWCIVDFGHARRPGETAESHKYRGGIVHFLAPEIARSILAGSMCELTAAADIYAAAAALFFATSGKLVPDYPVEFSRDTPWHSMLRFVATGQLRSFEAYADFIPVKIRDVLQACIEPDPGGRPRTAAEACERLREAAPV